MASEFNTKVVFLQWFATKFQTNVYKATDITVEKHNNAVKRHATYTQKSQAYSKFTSFGFDQ
jgi:hypothetical protein